MAEKVSNKPWSDFKQSDYTDAQYLRACLIDRGPAAGTAKERGALPVREPDGTLNRNACAGAAAVLSSIGGAGSARGQKLNATVPQMAAARKKLIALYKAMNEKAPKGLFIPMMAHGESELEYFFASQGLRHDAQSAGNTGVCLVALPRETDPIRLVGDEQKHATLLFLGDKATLPADAKTTLLETLQNVSLLFTPFSESIVDVARLGSDTPPALVAMLTGGNLSNIRQALLINPKVGEYLQNATQHPSFTPHVTLGYPDYQGEAELRKTAAQLFRVKFDRLALWWGDEQIEFSLDMNEDIPMAQVEQLEAFLAHHGVKGMKWGVRRSDTTLDTAAGRKPDPTPKGTDVRTRIAMKLSSPGTVIARGDGKTFIKKKDGSWAETHLSTEAEHLIKTRQTPAHALSNKDLQDAIARARLIEDYNKFFSNQQDRQMKAAVEQMQLQKSYSQLHKEFNPSKRKKAAEFVVGAAGAYVSYKKMDKATGGALSKGIRGGLVRAGMKSAGKHAVGVAIKDTAKAVA